MEETLNNEITEETTETPIEEEIIENETLEEVVPDEPIEEVKPVEPTEPVKPVEHYIGEIFENEYPTSAAIWCNNRGDCHIEVVLTDDGIKQYQIIENPKPTPEEEAQRIAMLSLTSADVERAIYKAKGMDFDDIVNLITINPPMGLDLKALKIELKANHFYRGNPYVNAVGQILGFTKEQLDKFFETGDYTKLLPTEVLDTEVVETSEQEDNIIGS